jgi:hypothetical protein
MAYYDKYKITYATKTSKTAYLYLQEDLPSAPTLIEYIGVDISLQYIPSGDEIYEPLYASELSCTIDVTDNLANIPDFVTLNDRKYFAKLFLGTDLEWCGYTLSDNISISYSTGRKQLSFSCVDGLGMLRNIPLNINSVGNRTNSQLSVLTYILTCLNSLGFPTNPNLMTVCSYFALDMLDREDGTQYEPFSQTFLPIRTFKNEDYTYENSYDVLEKIIKSFGCRLFQAGGKWWVVAINEFANENNYFTQYNYLGAVVSSGSNLNTLSSIQGYTGNTSGLYFINNEQFKLILKGFNRVQTTIDIDQEKNLVDNGNLKIYPNLSSAPQSWVVTNVGVGSSFFLVNNANESYTQITLVRAGGGGYTRMINNFMPKISANAVLNYSMLFLNGGSGTRGYVSMTVFDGTTTYYLNNNKDWQSTASSGYTIPEGANGEFSFSTLPCPISGQLTVEFNNQIGNTCTVSQFVVTAEYTYNKVDYFAYINNNKEYVKDVDIPFGYQGIPGFPTSLGVFLKSDGAPLLNWYRFGKTGLYDSMTQLLMRQYINSYGANIINIDCSLSSFVTSNATYPYLNASKMIKSYDTDPAQINVQDNSYMLGNSSIDYVDNSMSGTLLEISNTDINATINLIQYFK